MTTHPLAACEFCRRPTAGALADCDREACQRKAALRDREMARLGMGDWPAPEVPARLAEDGEVPPGARRLAALARSSGWRVVATYARGTYPGRPPRVVESIALRMWLAEPARRAVAVWHGTRFNFATMWGADCPVRSLNVTQLRAELAGAP